MGAVMIYEILNGQTVINTIVADLEFMQSAYPEGNYRELAVPTPTPVEPRHITVGAFFDRFGDQKWPILADANASVQALIKDASVRSYINLDDPQVLTGLQMVQSVGHNIDPQSIISAEIQPNELP
jgi:hypothetical protein